MIVETIGAATLICADARDAVGAIETPAHACVTDPPYGLSILARDWDQDVPDGALWSAIGGALRPGAHLAAFGHARTYHRLAVALEEGGYEIRDQLAWLYGSGMAKAHDVARGIDRLPDPAEQRSRRETVLRVTRWIRAQRDRARLTNSKIDQHFGFNGMAGHWTSVAKQPELPTPAQFAELLRLFGLLAADVPAYVADAIRARAGRYEPGAAWRSAERVPVARVAPALRWQYGERARPGDRRRPNSDAARRWSGWKTALAPAVEPNALARRTLGEDSVAANVLAHEAGALHIEACRASSGRYAANALYDGSVDVAQALGEGARFFYCAKAGPAERHEGVTSRNEHPTVKPVALMRWLCRLLTPPGGLVLDPFMGSGSTGVAALGEGFRFIGIERDRPSFEIACERIEHAARQERLDLAAPSPATGAPPAAADLFGGAPHGA